MSEEQITRIVAEVLSAQDRQNKDWGKLAAMGVSMLIGMGTIYVMFFQPATLAAAGTQTRQQVEQHEKSVHESVTKRLDRIEGKLDRVIETK